MFPRSLPQSPVQKEEPPEMASNNDPIVIPMIERHRCDLPETNTSDLKTVTEEAVLSFHNISYGETVQSGFPLWKKTQVIERLSNINGIMKPGLNAIMGPQDGSRSLLLDVLAARSDPCGLTGDILINGKPRPANFKCMSGYVPQLTITRDEKRRRIDEVLELLQLEKKQNIKLSCVRFQSLGQEQQQMDQVPPVDVHAVPGRAINECPRCKKLRKKTSIAMELVTEHPILFLDDPTTDLDLRTTIDIISVLRGMSKRGRTIIFSINRPQYSVFRFFDSLTLVASGKVMFHGPARDALEYFTSAGYEYESHDNPADFFLDIINGGFSDTEGECQEVVIINTRTLLIILLTFFQCITSVSAGELFVIDRDRFLHEHTSGYYRVSSYFFGKLLAELIPRTLFPSTIFTLITYITAGVRTSVKDFFAMAFTIMMLAYSASSLSLSLGGGKNAADRGFLIVTSWIRYISIPHYGLMALLHNEFLGQNFCPEEKTEEVSRCQNYVMM
ncbi:ATP-binding cassette sub-family G member 3 [Apodemus speciosus]|uniref:ATP-binding cassette sub-family G member 3 n=1 Tax=Apodemus speciosus TaxID=105296 RepID=A0ABQ0FWM0_APOSI